MGGAEIGVVAATAFVDCGFVKICLLEFFVDVLHGYVGGVLHVGGVEPIVAEVVVNYLVSGEIVKGGALGRGGLVEAEQQGCLAELVGVQAVADIADGADCVDGLFAVEERGYDADIARDVAQRHALVIEEGVGKFVAVANGGAIVGPAPHHRCAKCDDGHGGLREELRHAVDVGGQPCKQALGIGVGIGRGEVEAMPQVVAALHQVGLIVGHGDSGVARERRHDGCGVVERPHGVVHHLESVLLQLCADIVGEAGAKHQYLVGMADARLLRRGLVFYAKSHVNTFDSQSKAPEIRCGGLSGRPPPGRHRIAPR